MFPPNKKKVFIFSEILQVKRKIILRTTLKYVEYSDYVNRNKCFHLKNESWCNIKFVTQFILENFLMNVIRSSSCINLFGPIDLKFTKFAVLYSLFSRSFSMDLSTWKLSSHGIVHLNLFLSPHESIQFIQAHFHLKNKWKVSSLRTLRVYVDNDTCALTDVNGIYFTAEVLTSVERTMYDVRLLWYLCFQYQPNY